MENGIILRVSQRGSAIYRCREFHPCVENMPVGSVGVFVSCIFIRALRTRPSCCVFVGCVLCGCVVCVVCLCVCGCVFSTFLVVQGVLCFCWLCIVCVACLLVVHCVLCVVSLWSAAHYITIWWLLLLRSGSAHCGGVEA